MLLALAHCHERQIVHRDLKPGEFACRCHGRLHRVLIFFRSTEQTTENFVFETKADDSNMKLIDFGCAKQSQDDAVIDDVAGSPYYVAPEVLVSDYRRTGRVWKASDMWSVGVIVFLL